MSDKRLSQRALRDLGIADDQIAAEVVEGCLCGVAGQQVFIDPDCPVHAHEHQWESGEYPLGSYFCGVCGINVNDLRDPSTDR